MALSGFAYSKWQEVLSARCNSRGIELIKVNPAYSSQIGLIKFMSMYGLSSDTGAAMVLARRAIKLSERLPKSYTRVPSRYAFLSEDGKHVWSHWNTICRDLKTKPRHQYFTSPNRTAIALRFQEHLFRQRGLMTSQSNWRFSIWVRFPVVALVLLLVPGDLGGVEVKVKVPIPAISLISLDFD